LTRTLLITAVLSLTYMHYCIVQRTHYEYRQIKHEQVMAGTGSPVAQINGRLVMPASTEALRRALVKCGLPHGAAFPAAYTLLAALCFAVALVAVNAVSGRWAVCIMALVWMTTFPWYKYAPWSLAEPALVAVGVWAVSRARWGWLVPVALLVFFNRYGVGTEMVDTTAHNSEYWPLALWGAVSFWGVWWLRVRWVLLVGAVGLCLLTLSTVYWLECPRLWVSMVPVLLAGVSGE